MNGLISIILFVFMIDNGLSITYPNMRCFNTQRNNWDQPRTENRNDGYFAGQNSFHDNNRDDRRFQWRYCRPSNDANIQTGNDQDLGLTNWDETWTKQCTGNSAIKYIESFHNNHYEDRRHENISLCKYVFHV